MDFFSKMNLSQEYHMLIGQNLDPTWSWHFGSGSLMGGWTVIIITELKLLLHILAGI